MSLVGLGIPIDARAGLIFLVLFPFGGRRKKNGDPFATHLRERLAAFGAVFSETRSAMRRGATWAGPGERAPTVASDALAADRVHNRAGRASDGRTTKERRLFEHDVRGVASDVVGAPEKVARNPDALDWAARRGNREGSKGTARGVESVEAVGLLVLPFLGVLGGFNREASGCHLLFLHGVSLFFGQKIPRAARRGQKKTLLKPSPLLHSW